MTAGRLIGPQAVELLRDRVEHSSSTTAHSPRRHSGSAVNHDTPTAVMMDCGTILTSNYENSELACRKSHRSAARVGLSLLLEVHVRKNSHEKSSGEG